MRRMRYLTVGEKREHERIAKQYNIRGYDTTTFLMCSQGDIEEDPVCYEEELAKKAGKKKAVKKNR